MYRLVEALYGKRIHRLVQSTHHQGAQALAITHRLSLGALVTPVAWSVATMHTAIARSESASCRTRRVGATLVRRAHRLWCPVLQKHILPRTVVFFKPSSLHQLAGFYRIPFRDGVYDTFITLAPYTYLREGEAPQPGRGSKSCRSGFA